MKKYKTFDGREFRCSICRGQFMGYGNNGAPLVNGRVCDLCNMFVIQHRIQLVIGGKK